MSQTSININESIKIEYILDDCFDILYKHNVKKLLYNRYSKNLSKFEIDNVLDNFFSTMYSEDYKLSSIKKTVEKIIPCLDKCIKYKKIKYILDTDKRLYTDINDIIKNYINKPKFKQQDFNEINDFIINNFSINEIVKLCIIDELHKDNKIYSKNHIYNFINKININIDLINYDYYLIYYEVDEIFCDKYKNYRYEF